jgi:integrase/recombinase XerD
MNRYEVRWELYPHVVQLVEARTWLDIQAKRMLSKNTVDSYGRSLEDMLRFAAVQGFAPATATREHLAEYVGELTRRENQRHPKLIRLDSGGGLSNATIQLRLTVARLFFDHLVEEGIRRSNPVGRSFRSRRSGAEGRQGPLFRRHRKLPWIPSDEQWQAILQVVLREPLRNRLMFAMAYDAALRRQELLGLETSDIDPAHRLIRIKAETSKNYLERVVPYAEPTSRLFNAYLQHRRTLSRDRGPLFLSESNRNVCKPLTIWTWSKAIAGISRASGVVGFSTHTLRHLCLTDLARAGWDIHEIAAFAGHRTFASTQLYIHLSGRELSAKLAAGMDQIHAWRVQQLGEVQP